MQFERASNEKKLYRENYCFIGKKLNYRRRECRSLCIWIRIASKQYYHRINPYAYEIKVESEPA